MRPIKFVIIRSPSFMSRVGEVKRSSFYLSIRRHGRLFLENDAEVSTAWKLHVKDIKSCIVTFSLLLLHRCFYRVTSKFSLGQLFSNEPSSQGRQNTFNEEETKLKREKSKHSRYRLLGAPLIPPFGTRKKVREMCRSRMFLSPTFLKEQFTGYVSGYLCKW